VVCIQRFRNGISNRYILLKYKFTSLLKAPEKVVAEKLSSENLFIVPKFLGFGQNGFASVLPLNFCHCFYSGMDASRPDVLLYYATTSPLSHHAPK
jgi:hypothetical protein